MVTSLNGTLSYLTGLAAGAVSIWFFFWPFRRKYDLDYKLDSTAQLVRWFIVLAGFALALLPGPKYKLVRILAGIMLAVFLAWPNLAYHLTHLLRRPPASEQQDR
jgi:hypothetical protein